MSKLLFNTHFSEIKRIYCGALTVFISGMILNIVVSFSALASMPGLDYYSAIEGKELAIARKCGVEPKILIKILKFKLFTIPDQTDSYNAQLRIINAYYNAFLDNSIVINNELCIKMIKEINDLANEINAQIKE